MTGINFVRDCCYWESELLRGRGRFFLFSQYLAEAKRSARPVLRFFEPLTGSVGRAQRVLYASSALRLLLHHLQAASPLRNYA